MLTLTRRYTFSSAHRLFRPDWDDARNEAVYGRCARAPGHGHNYTLFVSVAGRPDPLTGMIVDLAFMDKVVCQNVLDIVDHRFLNLEVPALAETVPTSENLCRFFWTALNGHLLPATLVKIRLFETEQNCFEMEHR